MSARQTGICLGIFLLIKITVALECRTCSLDDEHCLILEDVQRIRTCPNANDLCYTWFDRRGGVVGVERGCVSPDIERYHVIQNLIGYSDRGCIKRIYGFACFRFCSFDRCN